jgi:uncharacterized membrane protein
MMKGESVADPGRPGEIEVRGSRRRRPVGQIIAPPRFLAFSLLFAAAGAAGVPYLGWGQGLLIAFDVAAFVFLASLAPLFRDCDVETMKSHARDNNANRFILLLLTSAVTTVILIAVGLEIAGRHSPTRAVILLVVISLLLAWLFANTVYALHYAHSYYLDSRIDDGHFRGIDFPGTTDPHYWDFVYFAFTLAMTFQTSDSNVTATSVRRTVVLHSFAAFIFNIGVLAFTINVLGSAGG